MATDSEPEEKIEHQVWSDAVLTAMDSFHTPVTFVDSSGAELTGTTSDELDVDQTEDSFPYLSQQAGRTRENYGFADPYHYVEHEYFLSGEANIYDIDAEGKLATTSNAKKAAEEYVDRAIVFKPEDPANFNGVVIVDILNASSKTDIASLWRQSYDYIMERGYAYVGITSKDVTVKSLKTFDPERYEALKWGNDNGIFWDILGQLGVLLKQKDSPLLYGTDTPDEINTYVFGSSQSGWYINTFTNNFGLANFVMEDVETLENQEDYEAFVESGADHIFDGYLNVVGGMMDTAIAKKQTAPTRMFQPVKATDVPFILLVGENDYNPGPVRMDADEPDNKYRHYVIAGGPHSDIAFPADPTDELQMQTGRDTREYAEFKGDHTVTDFNMTVFINAALENLHQWAKQDIPAPKGPYKDEIEGKMQGIAFVPERDEYGNMTTGIRSPQIQVPIASYYGGANGAWSDKNGSMIYMSEEQVEELYGTKEIYLEEYEAALDEMIAEGWILDMDQTKMMKLADETPFFGGKGRDAKKVEEGMTREIHHTPLSAEDRAETAGYTETFYTVNGEANLYDEQTSQTVSLLRFTPVEYTNYARVAIPDHFKGEVVLDLILEDEADKDISRLMKDGKAYVGITASPKAAEAKGGSWKKIVNESKSETEYGLLWDIISQTVTSLKKRDGLLGDKGGADVVVTLGYDGDEKNVVYTYQQHFERYDGYGVIPYDKLDGAEEVPMHGNDVDLLAPDRPDHEGDGSNGSSGSSSGSSTGAAGIVSGTDLTGRPVSGRWQLRPDNKWTFRLTSGALAASNWLYLNWNGVSEWYYFFEDGTMAEGWLSLDGQWYYMHPTADGTRGHMYAGWHLIDGKWYYFHNVSDGNRGYMLADTVTPDNYRVGSDGAWIQ